MNPVTFDNYQTNAVALSAASSPPPAQLAEQRQLIKAVKTLNKTEYFGENSELTFQVDAQTKRPVIRIVDKQTQEVVSQIPPEYVLEVAHDMEQPGD